MQDEGQKRAQLYLDIAGVVLVAIDERQEITLLNRKGCELLGYRQDEILRRNWFDTCVPENEREKVRAVFCRLIAGEIGPVEYFENPIVTSGGEVRLISWHNTVLRNAEGRIVGTLSSGEDITERHRLQQELLQAEKMESLGRLAGAIAHDFGNTLSVILCSASVLQRQPELSPKTRELVIDLAQAAEQGAAFAGQLLDYARGSPPNMAATDLNQIVRSVARLLDKSVPQGIRPVLRLAAHLPTILADKIQIQQVVMNLCLNAVEALRPPGSVQLTTKILELGAETAASLGLSEGSYALLEVQDHGCGMDEKTVGHMFDPFFTTKPKGRGMGLAMTLRIIRNHHGQIRVNSVVHRGTKVSVWLPIASSAYVGG